MGTNLLDRSFRQTSNTTGGKILSMETETMTSLKPKILVVTACGERKHNEPRPAWQLYKSPRIRAVYNRKNGHDMCILSTKYGLVDAERVIEPYEETLTEQKAEQLIPQIVEKIKGYDCVVYYRGGAGRAYFNLMREACRRAGKTLVSFGYKYMGDISELPDVLQLVERGHLDNISIIKSAQVE